MDMSNSGEADVTRLLRDLTRELQTLQRELESERRRGLPTRKQLSRFTSEVAIPGIILILETNIRALKLLRRAIRLAEDHEPQQSRGQQAATEMKSRAEQLGQATLSRLDETLAEMQSSLEEQGKNDEVSELVAEARTLQQQISNQLDSAKLDGTAAQTAANTTDSPEAGFDEPGSEPIGIDVEDELRSLKDNLENDDPGSRTDDDGSNGTDGGDENGDTDGDHGNDSDGQRDGPGASDGT